MSHDKKVMKLLVGTDKIPSFDEKELTGKDIEPTMAPFYELSQIPGFVQIAFREKGIPTEVLFQAEDSLIRIAPGLQAGDLSIQLVLTKPYRNLDPLRDGWDDFSYVNMFYGVRAKLGGRVRYSGEGDPKLGTIVSSLGNGIEVVLDGEMNTGRYHPTWKMEYLEDGEAPDLSRLGELVEVLTEFEGDPYVGAFGEVYHFPDAETFLNALIFRFGNDGCEEGEHKFGEVKRGWYRKAEEDEDGEEIDGFLFVDAEEGDEGAFEAFFVEIN